MHAGLLDVLHETADHHVVTVAERVHVHLDGIVQESIEEHGC